MIAGRLIGFMSWNSEMVALNKAKLPLASGDDTVSLTHDKLQEVSRNIEDILNQGEFRAISDQFPISAGSWDIKVVVDSLTDASSVHAVSTVTTEQATYYLEVICSGPGVDLRVVTFERDAQTPKAIPWDQSGLRIILVRTDKNPVEQFEMASRDYNNEGFLIGVSSILPSTRFVLGEVFAEDRVEIATALSSCG